MIVSGTGTPCKNSQPNAQADIPIIDATDRSISALRITKVMIRAMMIFSMDS